MNGSMILPMMLFTTEKRKRKEMAKQLMFTAMMPTANATQGQALAFINADKNIKDAERGEEVAARETAAYIEERLRHNGADLSEAELARFPKFKDIAARSPSVLAHTNSRASTIPNIVNVGQQQTIQRLTGDVAAVNQLATQLQDRIDLVEAEVPVYTQLLSAQVAAGDNFDPMQLRDQGVENILNLLNIP